MIERLWLFAKVGLEPWKLLKRVRQLCSKLRAELGIRIDDKEIKELACPSDLKWLKAWAMALVTSLGNVHAGKVVMHALHRC